MSIEWCDFECLYPVYTIEMSEIARMADIEDHLIKDDQYRELDEERET